MENLIDDKRIVELFLSRDESALAACSQKYGSALRGIAKNVLGDTRDAEECENETYLRAWNSIPPNNPETWLFSYLARITRGIAIDRFRRQSAEKRSAQLAELTQEIENSIPGLQNIESEAEADFLNEAVSRFLRSQSAEKRGIFIRRYWFMDSIAEIARRYGLSQGKVKTVLFRLRLQLKEYLEKEGFTL